MVQARKRKCLEQGMKAIRTWKNGPNARGQSSSPKLNVCMGNQLLNICNYTPNALTNNRQIPVQKEYRDSN